MYLQRHQLFPGPAVQNHWITSVLRCYQCSTTDLSCPLGFSSNSFSRSRFQLQYLAVGTLFYRMPLQNHSIPGSAAAIIIICTGSRSALPQQYFAVSGSVVFCRPGTSSKYFSRRIQRGPVQCHCVLYLPGPAAIISHRPRIRRNYLQRCCPGSSSK